MFSYKNNKIKNKKQVKVKNYFDETLELLSFGGAILA